MRTSLEDAFGPRKSIATCDYQDKPIEIRSFRFRPGEIEGKQGNYVLLEVVDLDTGEAPCSTHSSTNMIAVVVQSRPADRASGQGDNPAAREAKAGRKAPLTLYPYTNKGPWYTTSQQAKE